MQLKKQNQKCKYTCSIEVKVQTQAFRSVLLLLLFYHFLHCSKSRCCIWKYNICALYLYAWMHERTFLAKLTYYNFLTSSERQSPAMVQQACIHFLWLHLQFWNGSCASNKPQIWVIPPNSLSCVHVPVLLVLEILSATLHYAVWRWMLWPPFSCYSYPQNYSLMSLFMPSASSWKDGNHYHPYLYLPPGSYQHWQSNAGADHVDLPHLISRKIRHIIYTINMIVCHNLSESAQSSWGMPQKLLFQELSTEGDRSDDQGL